MIDQLPEGKSIGWMQAPPQWIFTHTVRFMGIVRIVIQDGEGFILIKKGKPLVYYFKHGRIELRGRAALDYFNSHPIIEFNLCKYNPEEFAQVLKICNFEERGAEMPEASEQPETPPWEAQSQSGIIPAPAGSPQPTEDLWEEAEGGVEEAGKESPAEAKRAVPEEEVVVTEEEVPAESVRAGPEETALEIPEEGHTKETPREEPPGIRPLSETPGVPPAVVLEEPDMKIIGQMKKLNGIVAISVFSDERNILLMGDVAIEPLLRIARTMLATTTKITPLLDWGSFVHMTLQIPEGNIIIAPYHENHLCILTTRTINIGHIRRILRDLLPAA
jgi:hypothetical protein